MFEDKSPIEMKDPLHDKWYLYKTKARREVLEVPASSLKGASADCKAPFFLVVDDFCCFLSREVPTIGQDFPALAPWAGVWLEPTPPAE